MNVLNLCLLLIMTFPNNKIHNGIRKTQRLLDKKYDLQGIQNLSFNFVEK